MLLVAAVRVLLYKKQKKVKIDRGKSRFAVNRGAVNRGFTVLEVSSLFLHQAIFNF